MSTVTKLEAAALVGVTPFTISRWVDRGYLTPVRPNAKPVLFHEADVVECKHDRMSRAEHDTLDALWQEVLAHPL